MMENAKPSLGSTLSSATSAELLRRARSGDSQALDRMFARYLSPLQRWAHRRVPAWARNAADTDDIIQDTLMHTVRNLSAFEPQHQGALLGYLRRALLNRVRDQFRQASRRPVACELEDVHAHVGASPLDAAIDRDDGRRYTAALARLRAPDRAAIVGRIELDYSYEQLALMLEKPTAGAARLAVRRALLRLADEMRRA
jgi:RNA polymerase sigma factor (sigma-70 family)